MKKGTGRKAVFSANQYAGVPGVRDGRCDGHPIEMKQKMNWVRRKHDVNQQRREVDGMFIGVH